jgi:hypothetical protein
VASGAIRASANSWEPPPYRSWPYPRNRLEVLARRAGLSDDELRLLLTDLIEARAVSPKDALSQERRVFG